MPQCLNSIVNQKFDSYEVIIVDDGSSDATGKISDDYSCLYKNVRVFHWDNHGLILTRRKGISFAKGEYVLFFDADDFYIGESMQILYDLIEQNKPDILIFRFQKVFANNIRIISKDFGKIVYEQEIEKLLIDLASNYEYNHLWSKAIKRDILLQDNCNYEQFADIKLGEDLLQTVPLFCKSKKVMVCREVLYGYRILGNSMSRDFNLKQIQDINTVYKFFADYVKQEGIYTERVKDALSTAYIAKLSNLLRQLWDSAHTKKEKAKWSQIIMDMELMRTAMKKVNTIVLQNRLLLLCLKYRCFGIANIYSILLGKLVGFKKRIR